MAIAFRALSDALNYKQCTLLKSTESLFPILGFN